MSYRVLLDEANCIVIEEDRLNDEPVRITVTNVSSLIQELRSAVVAQGIRQDGGHAWIQTPVRVGYRVDRRDEGHTHVSIFAGRNEGGRGRAGQLAFRTDEWRDMGWTDAEATLTVLMDRIPDLES